jgi:hypothetical protein
MRYVRAGVAPRRCHMSKKQEPNELGLITVRQRQGDRMMLRRMSRLLAFRVTSVRSGIARDRSTTDVDECDLAYRNTMRP